MKNHSMGIIKSAMIGMALGTAVTAAGAMYLKDNTTAQKAVHKAKESKRIISRAGENIIKEITD